MMIRMADKILKVMNGDAVATCNKLLRGLLESKKVDALLVPQEVPSKTMLFDVLISDPEQLNANVFAPVLPVSTAAIVSQITKVQRVEKTIGVVMRPCQIRAVIELLKLNQANLDNIIIVGVDCLGTFPVNTYGDFPEKKSPTDFILNSHRKRDHKVDKYLRSACHACNDPIPTNADIVIGIYGTDIQKELIIQTNTDAGERLLESVKLRELKDSKKRDDSLKDVRDEKAKNRMNFIEKNSEIKGIGALSDFFDKCVNCHNCMKACPICYCRECLFESSVFDMEASRYINKAKSKGLYKMPNDSILFHVTRMNHMILSCVGCGLCEQACPSDIQLMNVFIPVAEKAQEAFDYRPGKAVEEMVPMAVYREDEYTEVGEK